VSTTVSGRLHRDRTAAAAPAPRRDALGWAWLALCALGFLGLCLLARRFVTDDSWITARYAENLARGDGFVWKPEGPRVEGFSNPLLLALEAVGTLAGVASVDLARAIGVACGLALLLVIHRLGREAIGVVGARVALAVTAFYAPVALWAVGGLETLPVALALTAGVLLACLRRAGRAGAAVAALPWLRPEGLVVALAVAIAAEGPGLVRGPDRRGAARRLAAVAGLPVLSQAALEALRLGVYGHWLPNSVLYKAGTGAPLDVLERFLRQGNGKFLLVVAACGLLVARGRQRLLAVPFLVYAAGSIGVLDSVNSFSRFFLPVWPLLALLAGLAVAAVLRPLPARPALLATALLGLAWAHSAFETGSDVHRFADRYAACPQAARLDAAAWLRANTPPGSAFTISDAGLVPAQAGGRRAFDQLGLNEAMIQRTGPLPAWRRASLALAARPEALLLLSRDPERFSPKYAVDSAVTKDPRFRAYRLAHVARGEGCRYHLFVYQRARP